MSLPPTLRSPRLGYRFLAIVAIPAVFAGGLTLGASCTPERADGPVAAPAAAAAPAAPAASETAALAKADEAAMRLVTTLKGRVREEMGKGGPVAVVDVCSAEAPALAAKIQEETGVRLGRSSLKLRNPNNTAPDWVAAWLTEQGARPAAEAAPLSVVENGFARVVKPIAMEPPCLTCHGAPESIAPEVKAAIASRYPADAATGYAAGDLRGALWAELAVGP